MKNLHTSSRLLATLAAFASLTLATASHAKNGATDPIPGTSNGAAKSSTGGGKKSTTAPAPVVVVPPAAPIVTRTLSFSVVNPINGVTPVCTGSYHIDPYYPTLSLMTVSVETSSVNLPDGHPLYVSVTGTGGTLYPFTSNIFYTAGGNGVCTYSVYVTPGTVITAVNISDDLGALIASGN